MYKVPGEDSDAPLGSCWPMWAHLGLLHFALLHFMDVDFLFYFIFFKLKARPSASKKILNRFPVLV